MATVHTAKHVENDVIAAFSSCYGCDDHPPGFGLTYWTLISVLDGKVVLEEVDQQLSDGDTVAWHAKGALDQEWTVEFVHHPFEPHIFSTGAHPRGFTVLTLPAGNYRYKVHVKGIADSAEGTVSVS